MAKELPYFKFEPAEYLTKDISFCSLSAQGLFINICSYYWQRNCELTKEQLLKRLNYENELKELIKEGVIDLVENKILIKFLDNQLNEVENKSKTNSANGSKGGRPKKNPTETETKPKLNPTETETISETKGIREDEIKEDEIKEDKIKSKRVNKFTPPTLLDVQTYFIDNGYTKEAGTKAFNYYNVGDWFDSTGKKVKNWKQKMQSVWFKEENKINVKPIYDSPY